MSTESFESLLDEELVRKVWAGSFPAFEELVSRYEARVNRYFLKCCQSEADAGDLTQITFVTAFQSISQFDIEHSFTAWLFTIARHKFIDHCRRQRLTTDEIPEMEDGCDPYTSMDRMEQGRHVWDWARSQLTQDQFQALWLRYQEDLSIQEIAGALGRTQISVKVMLFRARQQLLRAIGTNGNGLPEVIPVLAVEKNKPTSLFR